MKIACISDTHNQRLLNMALPDADILLHAGDWTGQGSVLEVEQFNSFCGQVKDKYKYGIWATGGNHDFLAEKQFSLCKDILTNCNLMIDNSVELEGINFWFSPHQPWFYDWAFNLRRGKPLEEKWAQIPDNTNVLITHGGPKFHLATTVSGEDVGDLDLYNRILNLNDLKLHVFGHIHCGYGVDESISGIIYANSSICNEQYKPVNKALLFDYDAITGKIVQLQY